MSRIALIASLALATSRGAAPLVNRPLPQREPQFVTETFPDAAGSPVNMSAILWRPSPADESPFGLIPTESSVQPQLLPGSWDVDTVLAEQGRSQVK
ncbi:MAG TPA: hypothetical protein VGM05_24780 [Planctomycetaceae bacterium]|jgi:hypothetical protein